MPVIGDMRKQEFQGQKVIFGRIVQGYCYNLVLHGTVPLGKWPTTNIIKLRKRDVPKLRAMGNWELHGLLKHLSGNQKSLHKQKILKV